MSIINCKSESESFCSQIWIIMNICGMILLILQITCINFRKLMKYSPTTREIAIWMKVVWKGVEIDWLTRELSVPVFATSCLHEQMTPWFRPSTFHLPYISGYNTIRFLQDEGNTFLYSFNFQNMFEREFGVHLFYIEEKSLPKPVLDQLC